MEPKGIISPSYSKFNSERCEWIIRAAEGHRIKLLITLVNIPESSGCLTTYLEIRNNRENNDVIGALFFKVMKYIIILNLVVVIYHQMLISHSSLLRKS